MRTCSHLPADSAWMPCHALPILRRWKLMVSLTMLAQVALLHVDVIKEEPRRWQTR